MFKGTRVTLRAFTREDYTRQWAFENDPQLWFWDGGTPEPTSLERLLAQVDADKDDSDEVSFAIEADGQYIGHCSLHEFDAVHRHCEISVEIGDTAYQGRGYGREVVGLLLDYAFNHRNLHRVWLKTHSANERAIRCYRACGFVEEGRLRQHLFVQGRWVDRIYMGLLRDEYLRGEEK
ncbi:MAG: N-acetyltransferase [Chloroflexota bacterium]|nr:MAG: N-acetyltransferase [Chloroflexota bacterium]